MTGSDDDVLRASDENLPDRVLQQRLYDIFVDEAIERLAALEASLHALEGGAAGPAAAHHLSEAFRHAHTVTGGARVAGLAEVERVSETLESVFGRLRGGASPGPGTWGAIHTAVDTVRDLIAGRAADVDGAVAGLTVR